MNTLSFSFARWKNCISRNNYLATKPLPLGIGENKINFKTLFPWEREENLAYNFLSNKKKLVTLACLFKPQRVRPKSPGVCQQLNVWLG